MINFKTCYKNLELLAILKRIVVVFSSSPIICETRFRQHQADFSMTSQQGGQWRQSVENFTLILTQLVQCPNFVKSGNLTSLRKARKNETFNDKMEFFNIF